MKDNSHLPADAGHETTPQDVNQSQSSIFNSSSPQTSKDYRENLVDLLNNAMQQARQGQIPEK